MRIENDIKLDFNDVLLKPKRSTLSSRNDVEINRTFKFTKNKIVPIIASNMDIIGTIEMSKVMKEYNMLCSLHKFYNINVIIDHFNNESNSDYTIYSLGITDNDFNKFEKINNKTNIKWVMIDVANGYTENFLYKVKKFRNDYPDKILIAGNVCTGEITETLVLEGIDVVKVGIGSGGVCTTRLVAGVGQPQLSSVIECADAAHGLNGHIISDGGCQVPGDIAKAFGGGADFVMIGSMLAGVIEGGGNIIEKEGKQFVEFYGMSSKKANDKYFDGLKDYRAPEGKEILVEYKGPAKDVIQKIIGGLRSSCTYIGAKRIKDIPKCTTFLRIKNTHNKIFE